MHFLGRKYTLGLAEVRSVDFWRAVFGEFVATSFFLLTCLIGVWSPTNLVAGSLGTGLCIALLVHMFDNISGGNINPAVSLALVVNGQISLIRGGIYMVVQILGSIAGAGVVNLITKSAPSGVNGTDVLHFDNCIPQMADEYEWQGMLYEFLFTSMLIMQVLRSTDSVRPVQNGNIALAVGLVVVIANFCLIPITGGPVNPARVTGPAVAGGKVGQLGYYWLGECAAAVITPLVYSPLLTRINTIESPHDYTVQQKPDII
ncbi:aquaporin-4-like isoform X2 [Symsagittifera roscoffensis]